MDVTSNNFKTALPCVKKAIEECTFLSIDCELTGLNTIRNIQAFDTVSQYYTKTKNHCKDFLVIQYGLSTFRYDPSANTFKEHSFNFYIFRSPVNRNIPDQRFLCQASSISFLISQGFDFNKLFKDGISYLNEQEAKEYKSNIEESYKKRLYEISVPEKDLSDAVLIPDDAKDFIDNIKRMIDQFIENDEEELQLPKCNAFLRKLIYQTRTEKYSNKISLETRQIEKDRILFVKRLQTRAQLEILEREKYKKDLEELDDFEGFSKVLKMIVKSGKLVVGHNLSLDFLHTIDKFLAPLPEDYFEFKEMAHYLLNNILDTKYMANSVTFKDTISSHILKDLLDTVSKEPFGLPKIDTDDVSISYYQSDAKEHEAGYDAYITGLSFLGMWRYLGITSDIEDKQTFCNFDLLEPFLNRIYIMNLTDNQYINLAGEDLNPPRDHVFYLTFPKNWKQSNIVQLFSPFGSVFVSWIDDSSAYVALYKKDQAALALSTLSQSDTYSIMSFAKRRAILAGQSVPLKSPIRGKKRKSTEGPPSARGSFDNLVRSSKRSIDSIEEEKIELPTVVTKKTKKMFVEDSSWV